MKRTFSLVASTSLAALIAVAGCDDPPPTPAPVPASTAKAGSSSSAKPKASASATASATATASPKAAFELPKLLYHPKMETPADNPLNQAKIDLGKTLFFDTRLGVDKAASCENCHYENLGWADGKQFSIKHNGKANGRHTPSLFNTGYQTAWYWEGRAVTLEKQVLAAWKGQMGGVPDKVAATLGKVDGYKPMFKSAFGDEAVTPDRIVNALGSFVRSLRSGDAPFDRYEKGDKKAMDESAARGWEVFRTTAACGACHAPPLFTDNKYHNVGIGFDKPEPDIGREKISKDAKDKGAFKTPSLRSVTLHAPYFHDGSAKTIEEAIDYMLSGGHANPNIDSGFKKVELTKEQRADLIAFIKSLEGPRATFERPKVPGLAAAAEK